MGLALALAVFGALYVALATEHVNRTLAALVAAVLVLAMGLLTPGAALAAVDWNTLALLFGLMVLVRLLEQAGLFLLLAWSLRRLAGRSAWRLIVLFLVAAAILSATLPNVTVILILAPVLLSAAEAAGLPAMPLLVVTVVVANLGGLGTLIGDPPNILIGTEAGISFTRVLAAMGPLAALLVAVSLVYVRLTLPVARQATLSHDSGPPVPTRHLPRLVAVFLLTLTGFVAAPAVHLPLGVVGLSGGLLAVLVAGPDFDDLVGHLDWPTLLFFAGLFIVVGALEAKGAMTLAAAWILREGPGPWFPVWVMTGVALLSAFVDNIPIVAAAIPVVRTIVAHHPEYGASLWFALAIGAAVGGNATVIGASANVVAAQLAKARGYSLSFKQYLRTGVPLTALTWVVAGAYLVVWGSIAR
jgi:Na+/H+ antiporter NhaD/arsenite permease-like protein